jgi:hypothetical protein
MQIKLRANGFGVNQLVEHCFNVELVGVNRHYETTKTGFPKAWICSD